MNTRLALKAEIVLGWQLVTRHRALRLAAALAMMLTVAVMAGGVQDTGLMARRHSLLLALGVVAAVAASRLLAPGGALAAARQAGGRWWLTAAGRLVGALLVLGPGALAGGVALLGQFGAGEMLRSAAITTLYGAASGAAVMALAVLVGASAAAGAGLVATFLAVTPSGLAALLQPWPWAQKPAVVLANVLPLPWRAFRLLAEGGSRDAVLLAIWILLGVAAAGWAAAAAKWPRAGGDS